METPETKSNKILILGNMAVGKTAYVQRLLYGKFHERIEPSRGVTLYEHGDYRLWDLSGNDREMLVRGYLFGAAGAIIMYDVSDVNSYRRMPSILNDLYDICDDAIPIVIVGNKVDLFQSREVSTRLISGFINRMKRMHPNIKYVEISVASGLDMDKPMTQLLSMIEGK
jgi:small GTP-binding protein